ncbi:MAG: M42 family metallopeptidase [Bacillota bacterium]
MKPLDLDYIKHWVEKLCNTRSVTGNTDEVIGLVADEIANLGFGSQQTNKGALLITIPGVSNCCPRTLSGHVDTLGAMVKEIKSNGRLRLTNIGGYMWSTVEGEYCTIETSDKRIYTGTVLTIQPTVHVYEQPAKLERTPQNMEVRLDERVSSRQDVEALGIGVGDFVSFAPRVEITQSGFVKSRHLDDKASVAILLGVAKYLKDNDIKPSQTTYIFISNYEEIGHGASTGFPPETKEFIAVDMGAIGDTQASDEFSVCICAKDSSGPYHLGLRNQLVKLCQENHLRYKVDIYPNYGSDASAALRAGANIRAGLIGPGVDASHSMERTHTDALENTAKLLIAYVQS